MAENVDLVRSIYAAWERGDWSAAEWAHPDIEFAFARGPAPGSSKGLAGMADAWRGWLSAWEDVRFQATEYRELDDQRVLVVGNYGGRAKASGMDMAPIASQAASLVPRDRGQGDKPDPLSGPRPRARRPRAREGGSP